MQCITESNTIAQFKKKQNINLLQNEGSGRLIATKLHTNTYITGDITQSQKSPKKKSSHLQKKYTLLSSNECLQICGIVNFLDTPGSDTHRFLCYMFRYYVIIKFIF